MNRIFNILQTCREHAQALGISDVDILEDRHVVILARGEANLQILDRPVRREEIEEFASRYWDEEAQTRYRRDGSVSLPDDQESIGELRIHLGRVNEKLTSSCGFYPKDTGKNSRIKRHAKNANLRVQNNTCNHMASCISLHGQ